MAATKIAGNPTQNLFSLLADDALEPGAVASAPRPKKEPVSKKSAPGNEPASAAAVLTPAEKAKAREAKQVKAPKPSQHDRPPRRPAESGQNDDRTSGPRGTGNRGARRAVNAESHGHQAPARGRAFDRHSGSQTTRKPPAKKGGAGKGNWGDTVKDSVVDQDTAAAVSGWGDSSNKPAVEDSKEKAEEEATAETANGDGDVAGPAEPEEKQTSLDDYLKQKELAAKVLAEKVGTIQPRKLENVDLSGAVEKKRDDAPVASSPKPADITSNARKGTKSIAVGDVLRVRVPPVGDRDGDRPRGRGRGRGGDRGGDRGRGGDRPPRGGGDRAPRGGGEDRPHRGSGEDRPPRGEGRPPRGDGTPRGAARGRGERGSRGRPLDTNNNRQFPTLGQ